ncbi:MAG: hypothetical protein ACFCU1_11285 [Sumerlaeia bacterium]
MPSEDFINEFKIRIGSDPFEINLDPIETSIWNPDIWIQYLSFINFPKNNLQSNQLISFEEFLSVVSTLDMEKMEKYNQEISSLFQANPLNPNLHLRAAILLGCFALQEGETSIISSLNHL